MTNTTETTVLKRELNLMDATLLVAGSMIGSGIFIVSADISRHIGSAGWLILVWLIGGFMTLTAALSYGELSGMYPKAGGQYVYLHEAYNPLISFLYGWSLFAVIQTGTIAAVGVAFSKYLAYFLPFFSEDLKVFTLGSFSISHAQLFSIAIIVLLTYINTKGIKSGKIIQALFTSAKVLGIIGLIIFGFIFYKSDVWAANWHDTWHIRSIDAKGLFGNYEGAAATCGAVASALVGAIIGYDAWNNVTFMAGEITNPKKNIGLSLLLGTLTVTILYVLINVMFTAVLPLQQIANTPKDRIGIAASQAIFGSAGTGIVALIILIATFGCNNGLILSGARVYYSMAKDGLFFKKVGTLNKFAVPEIALWLQCAVAAILSLSGKYGDLLDMISFVVVIFYILTIAGIIVLRKKRPDIERPYKAFGYPFLPIIYIIMGISFCVLLIIYKPQFTWPGLIITLIGVPLYFINEKSHKKTTESKGA